MHRVHSTLCILLVACSLAAHAPAQGEICDTATPVQGSGIFPYTLVGAQDEGDHASCNPWGGADVWFEWTATQDGHYRVSTCDATFDVILAISTLCNSGGDVLCSFGGGVGLPGCDGTLDDVALQLPNVQAGSTYLVQVSGFQSAAGTGTLVIEESEVGTSFCSAVPNSTGAPAEISAFGSRIVYDPQILEAFNVPDSAGVFFMGNNDVQLPFGNGGFRCVGGNTQRLGAPVMATGNFATITYTPFDFGFFTFGTRYFQYWYRDPSVGPDFFNTSNGVEVNLIAP